MRRSRRQHAPRQSAEPGVHQSFAVSNLGSREARSAFNRSDVRASVCIGSNLARMEMAIALKTLLQRVPDFELDSNPPVVWSEGTVRGPRRVPVNLPKGVSSRSV